MLRYGELLLEQWTVTNGLNMCRGCSCEAVKGEGAGQGGKEKEVVVLGRERWVWGVSGGAVGVGAGAEESEGGREEGCVIKSTGGCDAERCWREGGRCKVTLKGRICRTHVQGRGVDILLKGWTRKREHAGGMCGGCLCEGPGGKGNKRKKEVVALGMEKWVWGVEGGVVGAGAGAGAGVEESGRKGEGKEEECVIKSTRMCDAKTCWREGGRCKITATKGTCRKHFREKEIDLLVRGWTKKKEHAGGWCNGCLCEELRGKGKGGGGAGDGGESGSRSRGGEDSGEAGTDEEFHRFLAESLLPALDGGAVI